MKEGYKWRSKLVHGSRLGSLDGPKSGELTKQAESTIRAAFALILSDPSMRALFEGSGRETYLDELAFRT
jgi:hypothetical protein